MRKIRRIDAFLVLFLLALLVAFYALYMNDTSGLSKSVSRDLGVDVSQGKVLQAAENSSWMDRTAFAKWQFSEEDAEQLEKAMVADRDWHPLPMPTHFYATHHDVRVGDTLYGYRLMVDVDGEPARIPEIEDGHYYLRELRPTPEDAKQIEDLGGTVPREFVLAVYDAQNQTLYYYLQTM